MNGYNFTERVRQVLAFAREEAGRLHHPYVATEHVLLGIVREGEGVAAVMLENLGAPLEEVRARVEALVKPGASGPPGPNLPYTSRGKKVLELAMKAALGANHRYVGTEHLLLGLILEEKGIGGQVLTSFGLTGDALRAEMLRILGSDPAPRTSAADRVEFRVVNDGRGIGGVSTPLSPRMKTVLAEARRVAARGRATQLDALHVAIGLLEHRAGTAMAALDRVNFDVPRVVAELEAMMPPPADSAAAIDIIPFAPNFFNVLAAAVTEQQAWNDQAIGTHHLLVALLQTCPDIAQPFSTQDVTAERLRAEARRVID